MRRPRLPVARLALVGLVGLCGALGCGSDDTVTLPDPADFPPEASRPENDSPGAGAAVEESDG